MKIIDIKSRFLNVSELPEKEGFNFQIGIEKVTGEGPRNSSPYGLEIGRKEMTRHYSFWKHPFKFLWSFLKTIRLLGFSFRTQFGLKRYRVKIAFLIGCLLVFFITNALGVAGSALEAKEALAQKKGFAFGQVANASQALFAASVALKEANKRLASLGKVPEIAGSLPFGASSKAAKGAETLTKGSAWAELFLRLAGFYQPRYYLLLFQNNAEIRPTGGFIGSYALVKIDNGVLEIKKAENVFNLSGQQSLLLTPPLAIQKISEN